MAESISWKLTARFNLHNEILNRIYLIVFTSRCFDCGFAFFNHLKMFCYIEKG